MAPQVVRLVAERSRCPACSAREVWPHSSNAARVSGPVPRFEPLAGWLEPLALAPVRGSELRARDPQVEVALLLMSRLHTHFRGQVGVLSRWPDNVPAEQSLRSSAQSPLFRKHNRSRCMDQAEAQPLVSLAAPGPASAPGRGLLFGEPGRHGSRQLPKANNEPSLISASIVCWHRSVVSCVGSSHFGAPVPLGSRKFAWLRGGTGLCTPGIARPPVSEPGVCCYRFSTPSARGAGAPRGTKACEKGAHRKGHGKGRREGGTEGDRGRRLVPPAMDVPRWEADTRRAAVTRRCLQAPDS